MFHHIAPPRRTVVALCLSLLIMALGVMTAAAAPTCTTTCYVDAVNGDDTNDGTTAGTALKTIQAAVNAVTAGGQVIAAPGTYPENVTVPKSLTLTGAGDGTNPANDTILEGTSLIGKGIFINPGVTDVTIEELRVQNYTGASSTGIWGDGSNSNFVARNLTIHNNGNGSVAGGGLRLSALSGIDNVLITGNTVSNNSGRGIVIWDGFKTNITITNNTVTGNNCCGIELQDGTASGVTVTGNTVSNQGDSGMAFTGLMAGAGPNRIANNTLTDNGRFGIEIKLPNGTGATSGDGSIVVEDNDVSRTVAPADAQQRDYAGIAAFRRGYVVGYNNVDIPTGVVIRNNTVSGYQQPSTSDGFGIVVEGTNMTVTGNTLTNNDVGAQVQGGHTPYAANTSTDGDQSNLPDQFFGRGNSPVGCALISGNTFSGNTADTREAGTGNMAAAQNTDTGELFCTIQAAIDDADTLAGHTIQVFAGTHVENVVVNKKITLDGAGSGNNPLNDTIIAPASGKGISITASGASAADRLIIRDLRVTGATLDGITLDGTGGSYLTLDNVASVGNLGSGADGLELKSTSTLVTDVKILNSNLSGNSQAGFRMGTQTKLDGLTIENTVFDGNMHGLSIFAANPAPTFNNVALNNVTITNNTDKGMYTERLNNATLTNLTVTGNGSAAKANMAGIDINLKYGAFDNITISGSTFANNGLGDTGNSGVDLTIKVRNDGSYAGSPATLTNLDVHKVVFSGTADVAMSLGNNLDEATTTVNRNAFGGANTAGLVVFDVAPLTLIDATCNWWNAADGPSGAGPGSGNVVSTEVDFTPWLYTDDLDGPCYVGGTIEIVKSAQDGGNTTFEFDPSWSATNISLKDGESETSDPLPAGNYSVAEVNLPSGWSLQSAQCVNGQSNTAPSSITLADGDAWVCTFTNVYTPPPTNICPVDSADNLYTDIIGQGMGSTKKHKTQLKLNVPNWMNVDSMYGQMVAKDFGKANSVRFTLPGKNNYVQVNTITSPLDHSGGLFWYGDTIDPAKYVKGRWYLQKSGVKGHIPRAFVLYPTYNDPAKTYVNVWDTFTASEGEVYWDTTGGWAATREIVVPIAPPNGPTTFHVELALVGNNKDNRQVWVTVTAGGVTQTVKPTEPDAGEQLNLLVFDLANVPTGTDEITIEVYSPSVALDGVEGDSAALVGMAANYQCAPLQGVAP